MAKVGPWKKGPECADTEWRQALVDRVPAHRGCLYAAAGSIWICSDQRVNDWKPADGAWPAIRQQIAALPQGVRVNLLAATDPGDDNVAVRVTKATLEPQGKGWELVLDVVLRRQRDQGPVRVPVSVELGGARSGSTGGQDPQRQPQQHALAKEASPSSSRSFDSR